jgi:hypothetical protein
MPGCEPEKHQIEVMSICSCLPQMVCNGPIVAHRKHLSQKNENPQKTTKKKKKRPKHTYFIPTPYEVGPGQLGEYGLGGNFTGGGAPLDIDQAKATLTVGA